MSVASRNPFDILNEEEASPPSTPAPGGVAPKQTKPGVDSSRSQRGKGGPASRGGRYYARGGGVKATAGAATEGDEAPVARDTRRPAEEGGRGRGRGRGRGGDRSGGGGRPPRRPFDRQSQTGKTDSDKKLHQGWGGDEGASELKAEEAAENDANAELAPPGDWANSGDTSGWDAPAATTEETGKKEDASTPNEGETRRTREQEEEDNTVTLEDYMKQKAHIGAIVPQLADVRKANEGSDDSLWKDVVPLNKDEEESSYFVGKAKSAPKSRAKKDEKVFLEIDAHFDRPRSGGRGRGDRPDRGRGRGGRGRGRGRGDFHGANGSTGNLNVDDQSAFPSLS